MGISVPPPWPESLPAQAPQGLSLSWLLFPQPEMAPHTKIPSVKPVNDLIANAASHAYRHSATSGSLLVLNGNYRAARARDRLSAARSLDALGLLDAFRAQGHAPAYARRSSWGSPDETCKCSRRPAFCQSPSSRRVIAIEFDPIVGRRGHTCFGRNRACPRAAR